MTDLAINVCVLVSTQNEQGLLHNQLIVLEELGRTIEYFCDPDECFDSLISTQNQQYLLILGKEQCHLVDVFSSLPCIRCIYLTEAHDFKDASRVQGIYAEPEELVKKLRKYIKIIEDDSFNYTISSNTEVKESGTTTRDIHDDRLGFSRIRVILYLILRAPKPTKNIYEDALKQFRDTYRNNQATDHQIDEFEKTFNSENAIWWYTTDSFLYRQINAAFRTENILTLWKLRFVIQGIYKQLELLHEEQTKHSQSK